MRPRSLVLATMNFPPRVGGIETYCVELARHLAARGVDVHVLAPTHPSGSELDRDEPYTIHRCSTRVGRLVGLAHGVHTMVRAGHDSVFFAQWTSAIWAATYRRLTGRPHTFALAAHGKEMLTADRGLRSSLLYSRARKSVLDQATHVFAVSEFTAQRTRELGAHGDSIYVVHPGTDAAHWVKLADGTAGPSTTEPRLLTVTRLVPRKGIDTVLQALPTVLRSVPSLLYLIAGDGPDRARLEALAARLGITPHVRFLGRVPDAALPSLYHSADAFVLVSRQERNPPDVEGFGLVLLEAQACGTPVVAARSGGMPDALEDGKTGLIVPPDDPNALARALVSLLQDRNRRDEMGRAARAYAQTMSWDRTAEGVLAALDFSPTAAER